MIILVLMIINTVIIAKTLYKDQNINISRLLDEILWELTTKNIILEVKECSD